MSSVSSALLWMAPTFPGGIAVRLQADVKLIIEEPGRISAIVGPAKFGTDVGDHGISHQNLADLRRELARLFKRNRIGHGCAHPQRAFVEMRHELSADERHEQKRGGKDKSGHEHGDLRMVETPFQLTGIFVAHPFEGLVHALVHAVFEPAGAHDGNEGEREDQRADERDRDRVGHRPEEFSRRVR